MRKIITVITNQKGQGVWEYIVTIVGAVILGSAVSFYMQENLVSDTGESAVKEVVGKVEEVIGGIKTGNE